MFKNKSFAWWIFIGWWLFAYYWILVAWWWIPLKKWRMNKQLLKQLPLRTIVSGTSYYQAALKDWQNKFGQRAWPSMTNGAYEYKRVSDHPVQLIPEPTNEHDKNAIIVSLDGYKVGYIPREICLTVKHLMKQGIEALADVYGGNKQNIIDGEKFISQGDYKVTLVFDRKA